ncbi:fused MFS/spermidine synthase [Novipirellula galeiformis]|nr:fused MFS/spermidine synthase [Novipirellula galeiformis]
MPIKNGERVSKNNSQGENGVMEHNRSASSPRSPVPLLLSASARLLPFYLIFTASGFAALVYEVSWNRQLGLLFGHTSHAAAVVLAAYFGGMAIGYAIGGRLASRMCPFRGYATCELIAGLWAIAIPVCVNLSTRSFLDPLLQSSDANLQLVSRVIFSLLLLAPATIALGATLPIMNEMLRRSLTDSNDGFGHRDRLIRAYGFNVLGAVLGVIAASSVLLATVGVTRSSQLAAIISFACAAAAIRMRSRASSIAAPTTDQPTTKAMIPTSHHPGDSDTRFWIMAVIVSGAGTLALEVLYTRLFSLVFHNSTYTFSFVLIGFLLGLSLSALVVRRLLVRFSPKTIVMGGSGFAAIAISVSVFGFIIGTRLEYFRAGQTFASYYLGGLLLVLAMTLPVAFSAGVFLPSAWAAYSSQGQLDSRDVSRFTLVNTIAAALGAILSSFVLFPAAGLWKSFAMVAFVMLIPAIACLVNSLRPTRIAIAVVLAGISCLPLAVTNPEAWVRDEGSETLLRRWHSSYGWIDVVQDSKSGVKKVRQNLHYRFGATGSNATREFRQAHLPLLLHPQPRDVAFLGLGTGMTAAGAVPHRELRSIDIVELIPEVVDAVRMLAEENRNIVDEPRTTMIVDDARHFLATTEQTYDVIVSDLFVPWESETGYLYTVEQFALARTRLRESGLLCQWLPLYQLGTDEFRMIADSLRSVFPHVTLWWGRLHGSRPILALVASEHGLRINESEMQQRLNRLTATGQFEDASFATPTRIVEWYAGDWPRHEGARLNTDEHPWVEFHSPVSHRSGNLLRRNILRDFLKQTLETNPDDSMTYLQTPDSPPPSNRSWQRTVLFPEVETVSRGTEASFEVGLFPFSSANHTPQR